MLRFRINQPPCAHIDQLDTFAVLADMGAFIRVIAGSFA